jgi:hypothetical protein
MQSELSPLLSFPVGFNRVDSQVLVGERVSLIGIRSKVDIRVFLFFIFGQILALQWSNFDALARVENLARF